MQPALPVYTVPCTTLRTSQCIATLFATPALFSSPPPAALAATCVSTTHPSVGRCAIFRATTASPLSVFVAGLREEGGYTVPTTSSAAVHDSRTSWLASLQAEPEGLPWPAARPAGRRTKERGGGPPPVASAARLPGKRAISATSRVLSRPRGAFNAPFKRWDVRREIRLTEQEEASRC